MKRPAARMRPGPVACLVFTRTAPAGLLTAALFRQGFTVIERQFSRTFLDLLAEVEPDVILLAINAGEPEDLAVLRFIATHAGEHSVLALIDPDGDELATSALDAGAIAVLPATAAASLVGAQANAIRRAVAGMSEDDEALHIVAGELAIDLGRRVVMCRGERIELTKSEFDILALLAKNAGRVLSPAEIVAGIGQMSGSAAQARGMVKVHVSHLRTKLGTAGALDYVITVRGVGYLFEQREPASQVANGNQRAAALA
ncbi:MAG: response regulator transcription factor [Dehalococcoidia bacterium]